MENSDDVQGDYSTLCVDKQDISIIPECETGLKPFVGQKFKFLEEGLNFYKNYAASCGFDTLLGTTTCAKDKTIVSKYMLCNKEGLRCSSSSATSCNDDWNKKRRQRLSTRTSCMARVIFHLVAGEGYVIKTFIEAHNHNLVSVGYRHFMKINRKLEKSHKRFIFDCNNARIGPMRSFRMFKELVGGYENVGCSIVDFENFTRDLRSYVGSADAQMMLDKLKQKSELCSGFKFHFDISDSDKLICVSWANADSLKKYEIFGEVVSFDATYSTNKYNMIFAPFTGKDNHGKCVTFAVELLSAEDVDAYSWIFNKFKECVGRDPKLLITDQDPAIKIAVERVFPETRHRFCMWHIMIKDSDKIPKVLKDNESFASEFNKIVWFEHLEPSEFEEKRHSVMEEFGLSDHKWFVKMFGLRSFWIPAYFRNVNLSGLFRTTSMSESENSFFGRYLSKRSNLVEFLMHYGFAMDAQRNTHDQLSHIDETSFPETKTEWQLEKHAAMVYPHQVFYDAQKQIIAAANYCHIIGISRGAESNIYDVDDEMNGTFKVVHLLDEDYVVCECKRFVRRGWLCRHMFYMFHNLKLKNIPDRYILDRWKKFAWPKFVGKYVDQDADAAVSREVVSNFYSCFGLGKGTENMNQFGQEISALKDKYFNLIHSSSTVDGKNNELQQLYGSTVPESVVVSNPDVVKNKGSGRRLKSRKETEVLRTLRAPRKCSKCKKICHHDARNYPSANL